MPAVVFVAHLPGSVHPAVAGLASEVAPPGGGSPQARPVIAPRPCGRFSWQGACIISRGNPAPQGACISRGSTEHGPSPATWRRLCDFRPPGCAISARHPSSKGTDSLRFGAVTSTRQITSGARSLHGCRAGTQTAPRADGHRDGRGRSPARRAPAQSQLLGLRRGRQLPTQEPRRCFASRARAARPFSRPSTTKVGLSDPARSARSACRSRGPRPTRVSRPLGWSTLRPRRSPASPHNLRLSYGLGPST
jgi:hypothetical protein